MIECVIGPKGSGKTKRMIDMANEELAVTKGNILFINDRDHYRVTINRQIRFINTDDFRINGVDELYGFICGLMASNYDISAIFVDNALRIIDANGPAAAELLLDKLNKLDESKTIKIVISISSDESLPFDISKFENCNPEILTI